MAHIRFDPEPVRSANHVHNAYVSGAEPECAFVSFMVLGTGVEALVEGARLANVQRRVIGRPILLDELGHDVHAGDSEKLGIEPPQFEGMTLPAKAVPKD